MYLCTHFIAKYINKLETIHPTKKSYFKDFVEITKARLAISVVFSTLAGYLLGIDSWSSHNWWVIFLLAIGGYCMVGASNVFNQIIEKDGLLQINNQTQEYCFFVVNQYGNVYG